MNAPTKLNGHAVIGTGGSRHGHDALTVLVDRADADFPRYVVATWSPNCGTEWMWGNYCHTFADACRTFLSKLPEKELA